MKLFSTLALLVGLSVLAAMSASKALWGFCCIPPTIRFADRPTPEGIAWFENAAARGRDTRWSDVEAKQNQFIKSGLEGCASDVHAFADCTFARILVRNGSPRDWLSARSLLPAEREGHLSVALECLRTMGVADEAPYFGILGRARTTEGMHWAFVSAETTKKNTQRISGERRHVECAWPENGGVRSFVWHTYRYDVAGIEFLTPVAMACGFGFMTLTFFVVARRARTALRPNSDEKG